jgi:predicted DNA-binding transcriptional regulator YafY
MPPLVFTPAEAASLSLGAGLVEELWGSLYREAARAALAKLDNVLPEAQRRETAWARRSLAATRLHRADPERLAPILDRLRQAVYARRRVRMLYQSGGSAGGSTGGSTEPAWRELDPYALVFRSGWWYTAGYCHRRRAVRTFRLDRIQELSLEEATFDVPPDFDVRAYLESEYGQVPLLRARLRFAPEGVPLAHSSRALWETLEDQPDGSALGTLVAPDLPWLASTVLSFGPLLEVLDPPELRRMVAEWAQGTLALYRD